MLKKKYARHNFMSSRAICKMEKSQKTLVQNKKEKNVLTIFLYCHTRYMLKKIKYVRHNFMSSRAICKIIIM
jgi:hypothetical protein